MCFKLLKRLHQTVWIQWGTASTIGLSTSFNTNESNWYFDAIASQMALGEHGTCVKKLVHWKGFAFWDSTAIPIYPYAHFKKHTVASNLAVVERKLVRASGNHVCSAHGRPRGDNWSCVLHKVHQRHASESSSNTGSPRFHSTHGLYPNASSWRPNLTILGGPVFGRFGVENFSPLSFYVGAIHWFQFRNSGSWKSNTTTPINAFSKKTIEIHPYVVGFFLTE